MSKPLTNLGPLRSALAEALRDNTVQELARTLDVPTDRLLEFLTNWRQSPEQEFLLRCLDWYGRQHSTIVDVKYPLHPQAFDAEVLEVSRELTAAETALRTAIERFRLVMARVRQAAPMVVTD